ncbi:Uncharacterised protein [Salmonella enterica subsp. enterica serovar Typhi]|nr:Uncharacterised protein [Salmonella enterica subsp. enterica serovar Typhi]
MMHPVGRISVAPSGKTPDGGANAPYQAYGVISNLLFAVKARTIEQELRQQRYRTTGGTFGFTGTPGGTGDIQVRPVVLTGKARQEAARGSPR